MKLEANELCGNDCKRNEHFTHVHTKETKEIDFLTLTLTCKNATYR